MTVYNGAAFLPEALASIQSQTLQTFEFVIVDDGSSDATPRILAAAADRDQRIKLMTLNHVGRCAALNCAWQAATGDYIANLDADDVALPDRLRQQQQFMVHNPHVGVLGTAYRRLTQTGTEPVTHQHPLTDGELRRSLTRHSSFVHSSVMLSRRIVAKVGGYDARFRKSHDYDLFVRMAQHCQLANLPAVLTLKRKHASANFSPAGYAAWQMRDHMVIRYRAWRRLAAQPANLPHVFLEPPARWLYLQLKQPGK